MASGLDDKYIELVAKVCAFVLVCLCAFVLLTTVYACRCCLLPTQVRRWAGESKRTSDLYGTKKFLGKLGNQITREFTSVQNVYTQHTPLVRVTLDSLLKNKLKDSYPYFDSSSKVCTTTMLVDDAN